MSQKRTRRITEEDPLLFDLPLAAPAPADRRARRATGAAPVQADLFATALEEDEDELALEREPAARSERAARGEASPEVEPEAPEAVPSGPVSAGLGSRLLAGLGDAVLHLGALGGAYLGVIALGVEPRVGDWPAFATLLLSFSFVSSVVSLAFWGQTAGMAWRGLMTRDRLQRPLTFRQAALRWVGGLLTFACAGLPLLFTLGRASLGDWLSRSVTYSMSGAAPHRLP